MSMKLVNIREMRERLELLQAPKVRMEEKLRERRAYEAAFARYVMYGIAQNALKKEQESAGGYLVPDEMESRIVDKLNERKGDFANDITGVHHQERRDVAELQEPRGDLRDDFQER